MLHYYSTKLGTITIVKKQRNNKDEEVLQKFKIDIRQGNCLAVFLYVYKQEKPQDPKKPYIHQLMNFLSCDEHLKNCVKAWKQNVFAYMLSADKVTKVKLNLFYKESKTLLKYMIRDGLKVECYYKEPNKK